MSGQVVFYSVGIILVIAAVTIFTRFAPFLIFGRSEKVPSGILYLGAAMPAAVIAMLIIYCIRNTEFLAAPFGIPEILACGVTALVHWCKRNTLLSIGIGTVLYMVMVQMIFV